MSPAPPRDSATPPDRFRGRHIRHPPSHGPAPVIPRDREGSGGSEMVPDGGRMSRDCCCWVGAKGADRTSLATRGAKRGRSTDLETHSDNFTSNKALSESRQKKKAGSLQKSNLRGERRL